MGKKYLLEWHIPYTIYIRMLPPTFKPHTYIHPFHIHSTLTSTNYIVNDVLSCNNHFDPNVYILGVGAYNQCGLCRERGFMNLSSMEANKCVHPQFLENLHLPTSMIVFFKLCPPKKNFLCRVLYTPHWIEVGYIKIHLLWRDCTNTFSSK